MTPREFLTRKIGYYNHHHLFSRKEIYYEDIENWLDEYKKQGDCEHPYADVFRKMDFEQCMKCQKILCEG